MPIDEKEVARVAELACLSLTKEETTTMAKDLDRIVAYVEELAQLDTSNVPPTSHVLMGKTAWRPDVVEQGLSHEQALDQAPRSSQGGFAVPAYVGEG
jgi:aspartyl-tRNA(Asn)/glutamyl-tRNA(Gln) amidotransferase subunit C